MLELGPTLVNKSLLIFCQAHLFCYVIQYTDNNNYLSVQYSQYMEQFKKIMQPFFSTQKLKQLLFLILYTINIYIVDFLYELTFTIVFLVVDCFYG
jgi:hypothetical protein